MKPLCALLLALCLLPGLCACGETKTGEPAPTEAPASGGAADIARPTVTEAPAAPAGDVAGCYKLAAIASEGEEASMAEMEALGLIYYLVLNEDGTGVMEMMGEGTDLTWTEREIIIDDEPAPYTRDGGSITVEADGSRMVFVRLTAEEEANYREHGSGGSDGLSGPNGETVIPLGEPSRGPVYGTIGDFDVAILGAECVEGEDGMLRFWYEFTNRSDQMTGAYLELFLDAFQDGEALDIGYPDEGIPEDNYSYLNVAPGCTIRCTALYGFDPDGGTVALRISELSDESVVYFADPQNLSGAPADAFAFRVDGSIPDFLKGAPKSDSSVEILDARVMNDRDGGETVRVRYRFTNNTDEETSFFMAYDVVAMQDGYELETAVPAEDVETDENFFAGVAPSETIDCAEVYHIRSHSPISVILKESWSWDAEVFGDVFSVD